MTTLLIVDDNAEMRKLVRHIASNLSDEILECEDGVEVLEAFESHHPDWVVMDVEMNRMDGLRATRDLISHYPGAKVIIMTKHTDTVTRSAATDAGAWAFCAKDDLISLRSLIASEDPVP